MLPEGESEEGEDINNYYNYRDIRWQNMQKCVFLKNSGHDTARQCLKSMRT